MEILTKRRLVGTKAELVMFLREARDSIASADLEITGTRGDTRAKRGERKGYYEGLDFAIAALTDWEPTEKDDDDASEEDRTGTKPLSDLSRRSAGGTTPAAATVRDASSGGTPPT